MFFFQLPIGNESLELEVTLPGEGRDRVFRVAIKWVEQVTIFCLYFLALYIIGRIS